MELFDYINDINYEKKDVFSEINEKEEKRYPGFAINRYFSFMPDTIFYANEVNLRFGMDNKLKHHFYLYGLRKKKRFTKWLKEEESEHLTLVKTAYNCSERTAKEYMRLLTESQLNELKDIYRHLNDKNS